MPVDPLRSLWQQVGAPRPADVPWRPGRTRCARCHSVTDIGARLSEVISDKFTGWDDYATGEKMPLWCPACAWGHVEPTLRHYPWIIATDAPSTNTAHATPSVLYAALAAPLTPDTAVIVPLSRKKHLLPSARWGVITTDDVHLPWTAADASLLGVLARLRALGFSETALAEPMPRFEHLRTLSTSEQAETLQSWASLNPWRDYQPLLQVGLRATRKDQP